MTKRKPLTAAQKIECLTLKEIWERKKPGAQGKFGVDFDIGEQGLVTQYLNAVIPLNLEVAIKFAKGLGVAIGEFAPRFEPILSMVPGYKAVDADDRAARDDIESQLLTLYRGLTGPYRDALIGDANKYFNLEHTGRSAANPYGETVKGAGKKNPSRKRVQEK